MSRRRKKGRGARYRAPVRVGGTGAGGAQTAVSSQRSVSQARVGGDQAMVRAVEMSLGARNQITKGRGGRMIVQSNDPAIPLDRVPYFTKDLVRLAVVGSAMVVLLGVGAFVVPQIVR